MTDASLIIATVATFMMFGLIGVQLGKRSGGRPAAWFIWGFVLGPVGWLVPLAARSRSRRA